MARIQTAVCTAATLVGRRSRDARRLAPRPPGRAKLPPPPKPRPTMREDRCQLRRVSRSHSSALPAVYPHAASAPSPHAPIISRFLPALLPQSSKKPQTILPTMRVYSIVMKRFVSCPKTLKFPTKTEVFGPFLASFTRFLPS